MALGNNSTLVTTAFEQVIANNGSNDSIVDMSGDGIATAYSFNNSGTGLTGDDTLESFGKNDSILNYKKIFDGNNDGIIDFGPNGALDIDRTGGGNKNAGPDQIFVGAGGGDVFALRYLGEKGGQYAYADASVRLTGFTEGTVGNDTFSAATTSKQYFYDTALGLNLGGDTITGFSADDQIVTTTAIFNGNKGPGALISFGNNGVLDLSGEVENTKGDVGTSHGGQIDLQGVAGIYLQSDSIVNGVHYYYYGLTDPAALHTSMTV